MDLIGMAKTASQAVSSWREDDPVCPIAGPNVEVSFFILVNEVFVVPIRHPYPKASEGCPPVGRIRLAAIAVDVHVVVVVASLHVLLYVLFVWVR